MRAGPSIPLLVVSLVPGIAQGCGAEPPPPVALRLRQFALEGETAVLLNEALDFHFDDELDPASVTAESVRVVDADGRAARGRLEVLGSRLTFRPDLPLARDLSDGGFRPETAYRVRLLGFPLPDALRSLAGRPLERTLRLSFRTVAAGSDAPGPVFEDPSLRLTRTLQLVSERIDPIDPILLETSEGVHPATLDGDDFELRGGGGRERVPLRAILLSNEPDGARIALTPRGSDPSLRRSLAPGTYHLWADPVAFGLTDLGGQPVLPPWIQPVVVEVVERDRGQPGRFRPAPQGEGAGAEPGSGPGAGTVETDRMHESFLEPRRRSPLSVEGVDGTAWWDETGVVTIRLPAAVGSGRDGEVVLAEREERLSIEALRIALPAGRRSVIDAGGHLVVLRAQGSLVVQGDLVVHRPAFRALVFGLRVAGRLFHRPPKLLRRLVRPPYSGYYRLDQPFPEDRSLSVWLEEAQRRDAPWTVLVAGGDLRVEGSLRSDSPLLLVAGGWIRASGSVEAAEIFVRGTGGGNLDPAPARMPLALDPPLANPLREPLTWAVLSQPWQPPRGVERWLPARYLGRAGDGAYRVRFLGERRGPEGDEVLGPVDDPTQLEGCQAVRFLVELDMPAGGAWFPPLVDFVELAWVVPAEDGR